MNGINHIRVLLIEDDEDDYILTSGLLADLKDQRYALDWVRSYTEGLKVLVQNRHDVCLVDYRLGAENGVDLLQTAMAGGCQMPVILLTGQGEHEVDVAAMRAGASDYLAKGRLEASQLERAIRYAIDRRRAAAQAAFEQARIAAFGTEVGLALTRPAPLDSILKDCANAMAQYLNAALAQVWVYNARLDRLEPGASAGALAEKFAAPAGPSAPTAPVDPAARRPCVVPLPVLRSSTAEGGPPKASAAPELAWLQDEKIVSAAVYPLMLEDRLVGSMTLLSAQAFNETVLQEMSSVASGVALCIQRKLAEEALDASESRYRSVVENLKEVIFQLNEFGQWVFLNPAWTAATGFGVQETMGTFFLDYVHHDDREPGRCIFLQLMERKMDYCRYETRLLTKDGKVRWVELFLQFTQGADGAVMGASGSLNDITDWKAAQAEVQKLAAFPRVNPNPVLEFNPDGSLSYANEAALELAKSFGKETLTDILPPEAARIVQCCLAEGTKHLREEVSLNGRTVTWSFFPIAASRVVHCYGADITEMLALEAQFRHAQKLESVGQMAAGIAHDFNNVLTVIQGYADCLLARHQDNEKVMVPAKRIADAARRATALTRQLLLFSRKQVLQPKMLDLNSVIRGLESMLPRLLCEDIAMTLQCGERLPKIEADAGMIEQVIMNLAVNSRDAMPRGGRLDIATTAVSIDAAYASRRPDARPGQFVCLTVTDTGCGMDKQTLNRIFEPFFSTKEVGRGTGLGLATVHGIVKQHQGWIEVSSQIGAGTTFRIFFPAADKPGEAGSASSETTRPIRGGRETILVVEDEPIVRELVREVLGQYNYRILQAGSGVEALQVWDENAGAIDLLLTDMVMPEGMTGRDLATHLRKRDPDLKVIYTSGYAPSSVGGESREGETTFLQKPYHPPKLAELVRACLDKEIKSAVT